MAADTIAATRAATLADAGCHSVHGPLTTNDTGRPSSEAASTRSVSLGHTGSLPCQVTTVSAKNGGVRWDGAIENACMSRPAALKKAGQSARRAIPDSCAI
jgi:hypothetical protein